MLIFFVFTIIDFFSGRCVAPPPTPNPFSKIRFKAEAEFFFLICISVDSEWSKTNDFERKIQNKTKSLKFLNYSPLSIIKISIYTIPGAQTG